MKIDLYKLVELICSFSAEKVNSFGLPGEEKMLNKTKLSNRFSASSNFSEQAKKLNL